MTGGYEESIKINKILGEVAEKFKLPIGVGSQRQLIESSEFHNSFKIIRKVAPSVPIIGNIGAAEIANLKKCFINKKISRINFSRCVCGSFKSFAGIFATRRKYKLRWRFKWN